MKKRNYRLALERIELAIGVLRLVKLLVELVSMAINYPQSRCQQSGLLVLS